MWDKLEKTFHLMHLLTVVLQLAANKTNRRTSLLCQNKEYKQLLISIEHWFVLQNFWISNWESNSILGLPNFFEQCSEGKISSEKLFLVWSKKGLAFQKLNWIPKAWIGNLEEV